MSPLKMSPTKNKNNKIYLFFLIKKTFFHQKKDSRSENQKHIFLFGLG